MSSRHRSAFATRVAIGCLTLGLWTWAVPTWAACVQVRTVTSSVPRGASFLYTPGHPFNGPGQPGGGTMTYYARGVFWSFGGGDPAYRSGNDSGYFRGIYPYGVNSWLHPSYVGSHPAFLGGGYGHWQYTTVDGCVDNDGSDPDGPDADECVVVLLADQASEGVGYFAVLSTNPEPNNRDFEFAPHTGFPKKIVLAPIPGPRLTRPAVARNGKLEFEATVDAPPVDREHGFYLRCHADEILEGYRLYVRRLPPGTPPPSAFNSQTLRPQFGPEHPPWEPLTDDALPFGRPARLRVDCDAAADLYLCATLTFGGVAEGARPYETENCSANSEKLVCPGG